MFRNSLEEGTCLNIVSVGCGQCSAAKNQPSFAMGCCMALADGLAGQELCLPVFLTRPRSASISVRSLFLSHSWGS